MFHDKLSIFYFWSGLNENYPIGGFFFTKMCQSPLFLGLSALYFDAFC